MKGYKNTIILIAPMSMHSLVLVCGCAGSGKSVTSREIVRAVPNTVYIDKDIIQDQFTLDRDSDEYFAIRTPTYEAMYALAEANLSLGKSVILDAPHMKQMRDGQWRRRMLSLAERTGSKLKAVLCTASESEIKRRLRERGLQRDLMNLSNWECFVKEECGPVDIPFEHITFDTEGGGITQVIDFVRER